MFPERQSSQFALKNQGWVWREKLGGEQAPPRLQGFHLTWAHTLGASLVRCPQLCLLLQQGDDIRLWEPVSCSGGDPWSEQLCPRSLPNPLPTPSVFQDYVSGVLEGHGCCDSFCPPLEAPSPYSVLTPPLAPGCLSELCFFLCLMATMTSVEGTWLPNQDNLGPSMGARDTDSASPVGLKPRRGTLLAVNHLQRGPSVHGGRKRYGGRRGFPPAPKADPGLPWSSVVTGPICPFYPRTFCFWHCSHGSVICNQNTITDVTYTKTIGSLKSKSQPRYPHLRPRCTPTFIPGK